MTSRASTRVRAPTSGTLVAVRRQARAHASDRRCRPATSPGCTCSGRTMPGDTGRGRQDAARRVTVAVRQPVCTTVTAASTVGRCWASQHGSGRRQGGGDVGRDARTFAGAAQRAFDAGRGEFSYDAAAQIAAGSDRLLREIGPGDRAAAPLVSTYRRAPASRRSSCGRRRAPPACGSPCRNAGPKGPSRTGAAGPDWRDVHPSAQDPWSSDRPPIVPGMSGPGVRAVRAAAAVDAYRSSVKVVAGVVGSSCCAAAAVTALRRVPSTILTGAGVARLGRTPPSTSLTARARTSARTASAMGASGSRRRGGSGGHIAGHGVLRTAPRRSIP